VSTLQNIDILLLFCVPSLTFLTSEREASAHVVSSSLIAP
jgi:hypothetical protein